MSLYKILVTALTLFAAAAFADTNTADRYIWLEDSANPQVKPWVQDHNAKCSKVLDGDPRAAEVADKIRKIITAEDRIPMPAITGDKVRNFWQDTKHVRGIWRQTSRKEYAKPNPSWETILDIDVLNKKEGKSWVFHGADCLPPANDICLITLSDGGRDEHVVREFQISRKKFVSGGFEVPPAKSDVNWLDKDSLLIATDYGADSLTASGYPRQVKLWKRGTPLAAAKLIFEGKKEDVEVSGYVDFRPEGGHSFVHVDLTSFSERNFLFEPGTPLKPLPFPDTAKFKGVFKDFLFTQLREDWKIGGKMFPRGSLVALPIAAMNDPAGLDKMELVFSPDNSSALLQVGFTKNFVLLTVMRNVLGEVDILNRVNGTWKSAKLPLPAGGTVYVTSVDQFDPQDRSFATYQSFTEPTTLFSVAGVRTNAVKKLPAKFDASDIVSEQFFATSKDGTKVPYFTVHKKKMALNGANPTLLYGYGGFEISETPYYLATTGKVWLEKGGVYVVANIRGGGEFGPRWHEAALKENRQRAYDDFESVTEDLFARKITSPRRLGIMGGSNGGLLVGVAVTQHPEYYHGVVCESALLDMLRYTKLPPGASWTAEYGDPEDPKIASVIEKYSPYQNVRPKVTYPKMFFHISTADDRVQPGHTRKMVARLEEYGNDDLFYENTEGGHGGAADLEQRVKKLTLENIYLYQQLMD